VPGHSKILSQKKKKKKKEREKKVLEAWLKWYSTCLARTSPEYKPPVLPKKKKKSLISKHSLPTMFFSL
jgi:hypothetical protein